MDLKHLRYFLAAAEERNFSLAARKLGISQPPFSARIKELEKEVGAELFCRNRRGSELTRAGQALYEGVRHIPAIAAAAAEGAGRVARGEAGRLSLGFTVAAALNPVVAAAVRMFRRDVPEVELTFEEGGSKLLCAGVAEGRLDAAVLRPLERSPEGVRLSSFVEEALVMALPSSHALALAPAGRLPLACFRGERFVFISPVSGSGFRSAAISACVNAGFEPLRGQQAPQLASILTLVAAECGVALIPESMNVMGVPGVTFRKLTPPEPQAELQIASSLYRPSALALRFINVAMELAEQMALAKRTAGGDA